MGLRAQGSYSPAVGKPGCDAIFMDSSIIKSWANHCTLQRGYINILDKSLGYTSVGDATKPIGKADNFVVSLGDSGVATVQFNGLLFNGPGPDFAVYENAFDDYFLELAFVEVSSDGVNFVRFPSDSETDTALQVNSFDSLDASQLNNLAGKYRYGYGVPFDLEDLVGIPGIDLEKISHIRIVDVVGSLNPTVSTRDSKERKVNDPFPTPFNSGGFDLDAVAAIHIVPNSIQKSKIKTIGVFPNPTKGIINFSENFIGKQLKVFTLDGRLIFSKKIKESRLNLSALNPSIYQLLIFSDNKVYTAKIKVE